jgi:hypothetical protein
MVVTDGRGTYCPSDFRPFGGRGPSHFAARNGASAARFLSDFARECDGQGRAPEKSPRRLSAFRGPRAISLRCAQRRERGPIPIGFRKGMWWPGTGLNRRRRPFEGPRATPLRCAQPHERGQRFFSLEEWWPGTGLNRRRRPFQGRALPLSYLASVETFFGCKFLRGFPAGPVQVGKSTNRSMQQRYQYTKGHGANQAGELRGGFVRLRLIANTGAIPVN